MIAKVLGCAWQRCAVHFLGDCLGHARNDAHGLLRAVIWPIFNADSLAQAARAGAAATRRVRLAPDPSAGPIA